MVLDKDVYEGRTKDLVAGCAGMKSPPRRPTTEDYEARLVTLWKPTTVDVIMAAVDRPHARARGLHDAPGFTSHSESRPQGSLDLDRKPNIVIHLNYTEVAVNECTIHIA